MDWGASLVVPLVLSLSYLFLEESGKQVLLKQQPLVDLHYRYRFRIISTSCSPAYVFRPLNPFVCLILVSRFTFSIDQHRLTVIETDGIETRPHTVGSIQIYAGQ